MLAMNHRDRVALREAFKEADEMMGTLSSGFSVAGKVDRETREFCSDTFERIGAIIGREHVTPRVGELVAEVLDIVVSSFAVADNDGLTYEAILRCLRSNRARIDAMRLTINVLFPM